ncbi:hypothetical protein QE152_g30734 [Popillia japonica]|uniref:Uncharacterized protein n=1 Tax=Popillia japonica TaxID=7064 RepID=A0AAW1JDJ3_POPJA
MFHAKSVEVLLTIRNIFTGIRRDTDLPSKRMVKVKEEAAMAEPKPSVPFVRKNRHHGHLIHHPPFYHYPFHNCSYTATEGATSDSNGTSSGAGGGASSSSPSPASFYIGPGFQPQSQIQGSYGAGPSQTHGSEHIVYFHVNPGVTINFQIGDNMQVLRGKPSTCHLAVQATM